MMALVNQYLPKIERSTCVFGWVCVCLPPQGRLVTQIYRDLYISETFTSAPRCVFYIYFYRHTRAGRETRGLSGF